MDLLEYYGLDWIAMSLGFLGMYLMGNQKAIGFLIMASGMIAALVVAILSNQMGFVVSNIVSAVLLVRAWRNWNKTSTEIVQ